MKQEHKFQAKLKSSGQIISIPHELISFNPFSLRKVVSDKGLEALAVSIRENGIIQPVNVRPVAGRYQLIAGERRLRAARIAGRSMIPSIIMDISDEDMAIFALCENTQRDNPGFFDEAESLNAIMCRFNYTPDELSLRLGLDKAYIIQKIQLLRLPEDIRERVVEAGFSERQIYALLKLNNHIQREEAVDVIIKHRLSEVQTDSLVREILIDDSSAQRIKQKKIFKDTQIFVNSIEKTVETIRESGVEVLQNNKETDEFIEISIRIYKTRRQQNRPMARRVSVKAMKE